MGCIRACAALVVWVFGISLGVASVVYAIAGEYAHVTFDAVWMVFAFKIGGKFIDIDY